MEYPEEDSGWDRKRAEEATKSGFIEDSSWGRESDDSDWENRSESSLDRFLRRECAIPKVRYVYLLDERIDDDSTKIKEAWPGIKDSVFNILESFTATVGYMTLISLFRLGMVDHPSGNPKTVYVSLSAASPEDEWPPGVRKMQDYLDSFGFDLHAHLEHNEICHDIFELLPINQDSASSSAEGMKQDGASATNYSDIGRFKSLPETKLNPYYPLDRDWNSKPQPLEAYPTAVCLGGDIGAARYLTREDNRVVGLMIAAQIPKGAKTGIYVVTPIEDVFQGIKDVSEGRIVDVKLRTESAPPPTIGEDGGELDR